MAINIGTNFAYKGKLANFERDKFVTKTAMMAFDENSIDEGHLSYCEEDGNVYQYKSANTVDTTTGKWRLFKTEADATLNGTSTNAIQNKAVFEALKLKADAAALAAYQPKYNADYVAKADFDYSELPNGAEVVDLNGYTMSINKNVTISNKNFYNGNIELLGDGVAINDSNFFRVDFNEATYYIPCNNVLCELCNLYKIKFTGGIYLYYCSISYMTIESATNIDIQCTDIIHTSIGSNITISPAKTKIYYSNIQRKKINNGVITNGEVIEAGFESNITTPTLSGNAPSCEAVNTALQLKADKTQLNNLATKTELNSKADKTQLDNYVTTTTANSTYAKKSDITSVYKFKGNKTNYADLPTTDRVTGDVWNITNANAEYGIKAGDNVAWNGTEWDNLSGTVDLSAYATKEEALQAITNLADDEDITSVDNGTGSNVLKFADRTYNADNFSGKGYKILRKNINELNLPTVDIVVNNAPTSAGDITITINSKQTTISLDSATDTTTAIVANKIATTLKSSLDDYNVSVSSNTIVLICNNSKSVSPSSIDVGNTAADISVKDSITENVHKNVLTQDMINRPNTIYEIKYDFDLNGELLLLPKDVVLYFNGGSFRNGVVYLNKCYVQSKFYGPIFIDILFRSATYGSDSESAPLCSGALYDYYFEDTIRDDDYLKLHNIALGNPGVITAKVLNVKTLNNPYYAKYKDKGVRNTISTSSLNLEGNGATINILADLGTEERPFTSQDTWGINARDLITVNAKESAISVRNISFIDDNNINGKGADFTKTEYTYNGVTKNVRGHIIGASFLKLRELIFDNVNSRSAYQLFGTNSYGEEKDKVSPINVLFRNVNVYSHTNFCLEIWGKNLSALSVVYEGCRFEVLYGSSCAVSNSALSKTFAVYRGCTLENGCLSEVGSYRCENCLFINSQYIYTTTDIKVEIIGCTFIINKALSTVKGRYFDLISSDFKMIGSSMFVDKDSFLTLRLHKSFDENSITEKKILLRDVTIPMNAGVSVDMEFLDTFKDIVIENMFNSLWIYEVNSSYTSSLLGLKAQYVNCGYVFGKCLTEAKYSRSTDYIESIAKSFPTLYNGNIEDNNKIVLDGDFVVKCIKDFTVAFNGVTTFNKFLTIRVGFINSGESMASFNADKSIGVNIRKNSVTFVVNGKTLYASFTGVKYREVTLSIDLEKVHYYLFINGENSILSNSVGSLTSTTVTLDNNVSLYTNGAQLRFIMFQPILLTKRYV